MRTTIEEIFKENSQLFFDYLERLSRTVIVFIDSERIIQDCNQGFLDCLGITEKPLNKNIMELLSLDSKKFSLPKKGEFTSCRLNFITSEDVQINLKGYISQTQKGFLILLEQHKLTYNELIAKMSLLNNELNNLVREVRKKNQQLIKANETIKKIMNIDPLTKLLNRRAFREFLLKKMSLSKRYKLPLSLIMTDIDHFKSVNDTYGHEVGDKVLKRFAKILKRLSRASDTVSRFGGEEFLLLLPNTNLASAWKLSERLRKKIEVSPMPGIPDKITASFGITEFIISDTEESFIKRADDALYEAKKTGRNRSVTISSENLIQY